MRVALIHNDEAGVGVYKRRDLKGLLRDAGHEVVGYGKGRSKIDRALDSDADVVAVAGGDGTVAKAAIAILEKRSRLPLFIVPVGTSNNIARSLGIDATTPEVIASLSDARPSTLDIGRATAPWATRAFVEAAGAGFFGTMLYNEHSLRTRAERFVRNVRPASRDPFEMSRRGIARLIRRQRVRFHTVLADGHDLSNEYVAIEVMNIPRLGPRIVFAPDARPADSLLDLLLVTAYDREMLAEYVWSDGRSGGLPTPIRRVRRVEMSWGAKLGHVDDEAWPKDPRTDTRDARVIVDTQGTIAVLLPVGATGRTGSQSRQRISR